MSKLNLFIVVCLIIVVSFIFVGVACAAVIIENPVIELNGDNPQRVLLSGFYVEAGATVTDNNDSDIQDKLVVDASALDLNQVGQYFVKYNATDSDGNIGAEAIRIVEVYQSEPLVVVDDSLPSDLIDPQLNGILEPQVLGVKLESEDEQLSQLDKDAFYVWTGNTQLLLDYLKIDRDMSLENIIRSKQLKILIGDVKIDEIDEPLKEYNEQSLVNFIVYGTKTTLRLGTGERTGVLNSYQSAYGRLPLTEEDWRDLLKIANDRWPSQKSQVSEGMAKYDFQRVYLRDADTENQNDKAAIAIVAYGLRPLDRSLESEKIAISYFEGIYGHLPVAARDWDIVRAIAYSGSKR